MLSPWWCIVATFLICIHILISIFVLSSFQYNSLSMKKMLFTHLTHPGVPSDDWQTNGDEETGLSDIHPICSTWISMANLATDMIFEASYLTEIIDRKSTEIIDRVNNFALEMEEMLSDVCQKIRNEIALLQDSDLKRSFEQSCDYVGEMYVEVQQKVRYSGVSIRSASDSYLNNLRNKMIFMYQSLHEHVVRNATAISVRECTCDALLFVHDMQTHILPQLNVCADFYAMHSMMAVNGTARDMLLLTGYIRNAAIESIEAEEANLNDEEVCAFTNQLFVCLFVCSYGI